MTKLFFPLSAIFCMSIFAAACGKEKGEAVDAMTDIEADGTEETAGEAPQQDVPGEGEAEVMEDLPPETGSDVPAVSPPGGPCRCDSECQPAGGQEGICVYGVCMIRASANCSSAGSSAECPPHLRCWGLEGHTGSICWPDCDSFDCAGECDDDGSCIPASGMDCDTSCGSYCSGSGTTGESPIGGPCNSNADCADAGATCYPEEYGGEHTGFVLGYCLLFDCPTVGADCGTGGVCVAGLTETGENVCMGRCGTGCREGYVCNEGFCWPGCSSSTECPEGYVCDGGICSPTPCTPGSCPEGQVCVDGVCVLDIGEGPGPFPGITCDPPLPALECAGTEEYCSELIQFDPTYGRGYIDYPENGETWDNQYRSWLRRDVVMLIQYATAKVDCLANGWTSGNGSPLGLIDMSEEDGSIPGTSIGSPAHPAGTHTNGFDIDVAYYQNGTSDNRARPICDHYSGGVEAYHCTATPHLLDAWRTALFLGALFEHPHLRVVGCDGKAGPILDSAVQTLCTDGWLTSYACGHRLLAYEETDTGLGWFYFHHHHMHISFSNPYRISRDAGEGECLIPGCSEEPLIRFLERFGLPKP